MLPSHEIDVLVGGTNSLWNAGTKDETIESRVVNSIIWWNFPIHFWKRGQLRFDRHLWLVPLAGFIHVNDLLAHLPSTEPFSFIEFD